MVFLFRIFGAPCPPIVGLLHALSLRAVQSKAALEFPPSTCAANRRKSEGRAVRSVPAAAGAEYMRTRICSASGMPPSSGLPLGSCLRLGEEGHRVPDSAVRREAGESIWAFQLPGQRGSDGWIWQGAQAPGPGAAGREPMSGRSAGSNHLHRGVRPPR